MYLFSSFKNSAFHVSHSEYFFQINFNKVRLTSDVAERNHIDGSHNVISSQPHFPYVLCSTCTIGVDYSETCLKNRANLGIKDSYFSPYAYSEMNLRNKTNSECRTFFDSPLGVPNSQVLLYSTGL